MENLAPEGFTMVGVMELPQVRKDEKGEIHSEQLRTIIYTCPECDAVVTDPHKHQGWHFGRVLV